MDRSVLIREEEEIVRLLVFEHRIHGVTDDLAYRPRRKSLELARIVRVVAVELALLEFDPVLLEDVADRNIRTERHSLIEPVHEHTRDLCLVFGSRFLGHYRSEGQELVDCPAGFVYLILAGVELVRAEAERGTRLLAAGEMGIGNTTTASALSSVLLGVDPERVTGRGAGLSDEGLRRKLGAIRRGIEVNRPDADDSLDVLAKLGGFDLAGLCGVFLGGALCRIPVLIDGFPSAAAALCAARLCPAAKKAMLASHVSAEPAGALLLRELGKEPLITAKLRLGEGSGAVAAMPLLDMALAVYRECYSFAEGGIEPYTPQ